MKKENGVTVFWCDWKEIFVSFNWWTEKINTEIFFFFGLVIYSKKILFIVTDYYYNIVKTCWLNYDDGWQQFYHVGSFSESSLSWLGS